MAATFFIFGAVGLRNWLIGGIELSLVGFVCGMFVDILHSRLILVERLHLATSDLDQIAGSMLMALSSITKLIAIWIIFGYVAFFENLFTNVRVSITPSAE